VEDLNNLCEEANLSELWEGAVLLGTSKSASTQIRKELGRVRGYTLLQLLLEFNSQKNNAHGFNMEEYFRFNGVKRQPLELLNHTGLCKSERTSRRDEQERIKKHDEKLAKLQMVCDNTL